MTRRPVHALMLGVALSLFGQTGFASTLEQKGQPEQSVSVMKSYGVGVATPKGLRTVVPEGWRTYVHPSASLPDTMSWKVGQEWTDVLNELASKHNVSVLVDWQEKAVYLRTAEIALDDGAKRAEVLQAATTPLPRFESAVTKTEELSKQVKTQEAVLAESKKQNAALAQEVASLKEELNKAKEGASATPALVAAQPSPLAEVGTPSAAPSATSSNALGAGNLAQAHAEPVAQKDLPQATTQAPPMAEPLMTASSAVNSGIAPTPAPVQAPPQPTATSLAAAALASDLSASAPQLSHAPTISSGVAPATIASVNSPDFVYTQPLALSKPQARSVAQGIANRFHLRLVWAAQEVALKGPVTLLGNSAEEDVTLLGKALGVYSPIAFDIPTGQGILLVTSRTGEYAAMATGPTLSAIPDAVVTGTAGAAPAAAPQATAAAAPLGTASDASVVTQAPASAAVPKSDEVATPTLKLVLNPGEPLEVAIVRFAREQQYTLEWKVDGGFEAQRELTYTGTSVKDVLSQLLPKLGISADIYNQDKHIIVRAADPVLDR